MKSRFGGLTGNWIIVRMADDDSDTILVYRIPLLMLVSYRGEMGERDLWQTEGGRVTEPPLRSLGINYRMLSDPSTVAKDIRQRKSIVGRRVPVGHQHRNGSGWGGENS